MIQQSGVVPVGISDHDLIYCTRKITHKRFDGHVTMRSRSHTSLFKISALGKVEPNGLGPCTQLAKYLGPIWFLLGLCGAQVPHIKPTWVCNGPSGPRYPMLCPLGFLLGYMGDTNRVLKLGFNWVIWAEYA